MHCFRLPTTRSLLCAVTARPAVFALLCAVVLGSSPAALADTWLEVPDYRIGPEDVLDIAVWKNPDLARVVPVRPDGKISLPLVNDVLVAGLTPMELRDVLAKKFLAYMSVAEVSVIVREIHSFKVSVTGSVKKPGRYELKGRATVLDVLALAEGFTEFAARRSIEILRQEGSTPRRLHFDYDAVVSDGSGEGGEGNVAVQPGDVIVVHEVHRFQVSVTGSVRKPGRYELKSRATVLDVLALAEGFTDFAARHRIQILRQDGSTFRRLRFDYDAVVSDGNGEGNVPVQPGDVIVVP